MTAGTETWSPRYRGLDSWDDPDILDAFWEGQARAIAAVKPALPSIAAAARALAQRLATEGRLVYAGAGASGLLAAGDAMEIGPTFNFPDERVHCLLASGTEIGPGMRGDVEDHDGRARAETEALGLGPKDAMIAVAASGSTRFTLAALETARAAKALTIAIANNPGAPMLKAADHAILLDTGPEVIAGSTRMNAGTAQKAALNLLSSLTMIRLNRIHDGLMVDLRVQNAKLRERAIGILMHITGAGRDAAARALDACQDRIKPAALVLAGRTTAEAERILEAHHGNLRAALEEPKTINLQRKQGS
ncbi:MAG TPA: N-acetylmuramic acid 6-phosphate etherase [Candidatus Cybelea sp.]|nr:N-acetylmuramic acid 6-phosphate etherase [Candidatus Cybelea sp.]